MKPLKRLDRWVERMKPLKRLDRWVERMKPLKRLDSRVEQVNLILSRLERRIEHIKLIRLFEVLWGTLLMIRKHMLGTRQYRAQRGELIWVK